MNLSRPPARIRQGGMTLIVGLIMLVLMTLMAITMFHLGTAQTVVVGNAQQNMRAVAAAQQAIDSVINSAAFTSNPSQAIPAIASGCTAQTANTLCVSSNGPDANGVSVKDFTVTLATPKCISASAIQVAQLDLSAGPMAPDIGCLTGTQQGQFGVAGAATGATLCATSVWDVSAVANDAVTNTSVSVAEGVGVRILTAEMNNFCPN